MSQVVGQLERDEQDGRHADARGHGHAHVPAAALTQAGARRRSAARFRGPRPGADERGLGLVRLLGQFLVVEGEEVGRAGRIGVERAHLRVLVARGPFDRVLRVDVLPVLGLVAPARALGRERGPRAQVVARALAGADAGVLARRGLRPVRQLGAGRCEGGPVVGRRSLGGFRRAARHRRPRHVGGVLVGTQREAQRRTRTGGGLGHVAETGRVLRPASGDLAGLDGGLGLLGADDADPLGGPGSLSLLVVVPALVHGASSADGRRPARPRPRAAPAPCAAPCGRSRPRTRG